MSALPALGMTGTSADRVVREVAGELASLRGSLEAIFVEVGDWLTESATLLNRITGTFEALPRDLASTELTEATARLDEVGARAQEIGDSFAAEQVELSELVRVVGAADQPIADLRRAVKMMGIVAVNARVVAAGMGGDDRDFDVFTTDIAQLSDDATRTIRAFSAAYEQLAGEVRRAAGQRAQFEAAHRNTLGDLATRLDEMLGEIVLRRQTSADSSAETGRVSAQIAGRIGSIVIAMQVGDSTRQRIEHVEAALSKGLEVFEQGAGDSAQIASDWHRVLTDVAALCAAQLGDACRTFNAEIDEVHALLRELAVDARTVTARSRDIYGGSDVKGQSTLGTLGSRIREAVAVLHGCETEREKLGKMADAVQATVRVLLEHVQAVSDIESNMRLVSLNAAVRCAQLGPRGRALNVIARQLRDLTGETVDAAEKAVARLREAASLAQSFGDASGAAASGLVGALERDAATAMDLFGEVDRRLGAALALLDADGPAAIRHLEEAAGRLTGHADLSEGISDACFALEGLSSPGEDVPHPQTAPLLTLLRKSYTMESERRLHDAFVAEPPLGEVAATTADDLLF